MHHGHVQILSVSFSIHFVQRAEENTTVSRPHTPYRTSLFPMTLSAVPIVHVCSPPYYAQHQETKGWATLETGCPHTVLS